MTAGAVGLSRRAFVGAAALGPALVGCRQPDDARTVKLAVRATLPAERAALEHTIAGFTRATGLAVRLEVITDEYMDVLRSRFAARKTPDVFYLEAAEAPQLIASDVLVPLDDDAQGLDDFYPQFLAAFRGADHRLYCLPKDYSTLALYINTAQLARAGFKPADVPEDFAPLMAFVKRVQARLPEGSAAMIYERDLARHLAAIECYGRPVIDAAGRARLAGEPGVTAYLETFVRGRRERWLFSPKDDFGSDSPGAAFGSGRTAMMMDGNWVVASLRKDYPEVEFAVRPLPRVNGKPQTMAFVVGLGVSRFGANVAGGIAFARYMSGAGMADWSRQSGTLPSRRSVASTLDLTHDPVMSVHTSAADYATVWSRGTALPVVNTNFGNQFLAALNGSKTVAEALADAERDANRELARQ
ncbi:extracellular solute-binding protein [Paucibacter sp. R3-3]|uniref:Extracellular solute-binding protein n=1 Tax=Roseateles agri TaxID=3098619 RepID=A0ABU5DFS4_9BURK|nr:extracellular solute-binding protein [Paucibacter sp. R3-3]MDY0745133.1 extracellular solute-binding protein [Paucibacter sp. R3-3]